MIPESYYPEFDFDHLGIKLIMTCRSHPEQYDAYSGQGHKVGYIRLRYGKFTVDVPFGTIVYVHQFEDDMKGEFDTPEERELYLKDACGTLKHLLKK
jgi:hypothetical protein